MWRPTGSTPVSSFPHRPKASTGTASFRRPTSATRAITRPARPISWGERDFYLNTPRWQDVKITDIIRAGIGSDRSLVHVYHMQRPQEGRYARRLVISHAAYRKLSGRLMQDVALPENGPLTPIPGYGGDDVFYRGRGHYSLINSCNAWTGNHLRAIGVRVGAWTPAEHHVMRWFPPAAPPETAAPRAPG
jgi:uncharacterized protein (TIGR02117 family)